MGVRQHVESWSKDGTSPQPYRQLQDSMRIIYPVYVNVVSLLSWLLADIP